MLIEVQLQAQVEHFDVAAAESSSSGDDEEALAARLRRREKETLLQRCEAELGACLWTDVLGLTVAVRVYLTVATWIRVVGSLR